jgi:hypothetical protein
MVVSAVMYAQRAIHAPCDPAHNTANHPSDWSRGT